MSCPIPMKSLARLKAARKTKQQRGMYLVGMRQGKQQNLVGYSGFCRTLCHMKVKREGMRPKPR